MRTPRWKSLLDHPELAATESVGLAVLQDAGETAHRAALAKWIDIRDGDDTDAAAGLAMLLANAFDDDRALQRIADATTDPFPEAFVWRTFGAPVGPHLRRVFGPKVLDAIRAWMATDDGTEFAPSLALAARTLYPDDDGEVYLPARRLLVERAVSDAHGAERLADELLVAAAKGAPNHADVQRTVLSYWGEAEPLDQVPTAEPGPNSVPESWAATCELFARTANVECATKLIDLALSHTEGWQGGDFGAELFLRSLSRTTSPEGDSVLLRLAKEDIPHAGLAVRMLAERRRRLAGARPRMAPRVDFLVDALRQVEVLTEDVGPRAREALAEAISESESIPGLGRELADALGVGIDVGDVPKWAAFDAWAEGARLPEPDPVPSAPAPGPQRRGFGIGRFFGRG